MCAEAFISREKGLITIDEYLDIENCIRRSFHFISLDANEINGIIKLIQQDKKNNSKEINCSLLSGIGNCIYDQKISNQEIANALFHLNLLASSIN
jgi:3-dehydroquinate synthase